MVSLIFSEESRQKFMELSNGSVINVEVSMHCTRHAHGIIKLVLGNQLVSKQWVAYFFRTFISPCFVFFRDRYSSRLDLAKH